MLCRSRSYVITVTCVGYHFWYALLFSFRPAVIRKFKSAFLLLLLLLLQLHQKQVSWKDSRPTMRSPTMAAARQAEKSSIVIKA